MKKVYMVTRLLLVFLIAAQLGVQAQLPGSGSCPAGAKITHTTIYTTSGLRTVVYIQGYNPISNFSLFKPGAVVPFISTTTDATGAGSIDYTGLATPAQVAELTVCAVGQTCQLCTVPPIDCVNPIGQVANIKYTNPVVCAVYVRATGTGETVRIYDANGIEIAYSVDPTRPIGSLICLTYDCSKQPTSISICGTTTCCSNPIPAQATLPVKLTGFNVNLAQNTAKLNWGTSYEVGSKNFIIEKSTNGRSFSSVGEVEAAGNVYAKQTYSFTDNLSGAAYYRLKMVDIDGKFEYSKVVYINNGKAGGAVSQIYPTIVKGTEDIHIIGISAADLNSNTIKIFSATGQQVNYKVTGANSIALAPNATGGLYVVKIKDQQFKIVKN